MADRMTDREIAERIAHDVAVESEMSHESLSALTAVIQEGIDRALAALGEPDEMETNAEERAQWNSYDPQTQPTGWLTPLARAARDIDRLLAREAKLRADLAMNDRALAEIADDASSYITDIKAGAEIKRLIEENGRQKIVIATASAREAKAREEEREANASLWPCAPNGETNSEWLSGWETAVRAFRHAIRARTAPDLHAPTDAAAKVAARVSPDREALARRLSARASELGTAYADERDMLLSAAAALRLPAQAEETPEDRANADMSLATIDAVADAWAVEVDLTAMIKNACSPMRLNRSAPDDVRHKFTERMEEQIDAIARQAFIEGAVRAIDSLPLPPAVGEWRPNSFYVASRASLPERSAMWRAFRDQGVEITSSWIDEAGEGETADFSDLWDRIQREIAAAERLVLYAEPNDFPLKGALIEAGIALGLGKPVTVCLPGVRLEGRTSRPVGSWLAHRLVTRNDDIRAAVSISPAPPQETKP